MCRRLLLFLISSAFSASASIKEACKINPENTKGINITFGFQNNNNYCEIGGCKENSDYYSSIAELNHFPSHSFGDADYEKDNEQSLSSAEKKARFLAAISKASQGVDNINLNMFSHASMGDDGRWYISLPTNENLDLCSGEKMTLANDVKYTEGKLIRKEGEVSLIPLEQAVTTKNQSSAKCKDYFVSIDEILDIFKKNGVKNVFGLLTGCQSGAIDSIKNDRRLDGLNYAFLYSSQANEVSRLLKFENDSDAFTRAIHNIIRDPDKKYDLNKDGVLSFEEVKEALASNNLKVEARDFSDTENTVPYPNKAFDTLGLVAQRPGFCSRGASDFLSSLIIGKAPVDPSQPNISPSH